MKNFALCHLPRNSLTRELNNPNSMTMKFLKKFYDRMNSLVEYFSPKDQENEIMFELEVRSGLNKVSYEYDGFGYKSKIGAYPPHVKLGWWVARIHIVIYDDDIATEKKEYNWYFYIKEFDIHGKLANKKISEMLKLLKILNIKPEPESITKLDKAIEVLIT